MLQDAPQAQGSAPASADITAPLILDFLEWLAAGPQPTAEVMGAWRTSCPRLTVWEDAIDGGYVARRSIGPGCVTVELIPSGRQRLLQASRPQSLAV